MYIMKYDITIGNYKVESLLSCEVIKDVNSLSDLATITMPGMAYGKTLQVDDKIKRGDKVIISLGYEGYLYKEFEGYVTSITNNNQIIVNCEDAMYLTRKEVKSKRYTLTDTTDIIRDVVSQLEGIEVVLGPNVEILKYDTFTIEDATAFEVLKKIKEETNLHIFMKGNQLHVFLQFTYKTGDVVYDFAKNVENSNLTYSYQADKVVLVEVVGMKKDNTKEVVKVGEEGGDKITVHRYNVTDPEALKKIGEEELIKWRYDGYEGDIDTWLIPYCTYGFSARLIDPDFPNQTGIYYVKAVKVSFSESGGVRKISPGLKVG